MKVSQAQRRKTAEELLREQQEQEMRKAKVSRDAIILREPVDAQRKNDLKISRALPPTRQTHTGRTLWEEFVDLIHLAAESRGKPSLNLDAMTRELLELGTRAREENAGKLAVVVKKNEQTQMPTVRQTEDGIKETQRLVASLDGSVKGKRLSWG